MSKLSSLSLLQHNAKTRAHGAKKEVGRLSTGQLTTYTNAMKANATNAALVNAYQDYSIKYNQIYGTLNNAANLVDNFIKVVSDYKAQIDSNAVLPAAFDTQISNLIKDVELKSGIANNVAITHPDGTVGDLFAATDTKQLVGDSTGGANDNATKIKASLDMATTKLAAIRTAADTCYTKLEYYNTASDNAQQNANFNATLMSDIRDVDRSAEQKEYYDIQKQIELQNQLQLRNVRESIESAANVKKILDI